MKVFLWLAILTIQIVPNACARKADSLLHDLHFEVSFGQSLLFIPNSDVVSMQAKSNVVLPTSSMLFFAEFLQNRKVKLPIFFNLPTESKSFIVNGQVIYQKASPSVGAGLQFKLFGFKIDPKSKVEVEIGPLISLVINTGYVQAVPIIAGRIRIMRGENFVMYIGESYTFGLNTLGMFYGTGSVF